MIFMPRSSINYRTDTININSFQFLDNTRNYIFSIIVNNPYKNIFNFQNFNREQRQLLYNALQELHINYTNQYSFFGYVTNVQIIVNEHVRLRLFTFDNRAVYAGKTYSYIKLIRNNNMKHKLKLSDLIYDIKDSINDTVYKDFMETIAKIDKNL